MRQYLYRMAQFTFYDRTGIQRFLEEKAEKGWLLDRVSSLTWRFRRIEPKKIHFAVTYFPKASAYDPGPSEQQQDLFDFCAHSGWVLAATTAQMQIFYNGKENPVPIETDPMIELENIHASAKKNYLPAYISLGILEFIQVGLQIGQLLSFPLTYLSQQTTLFNWLCQLVLMTMCLTETIGYFRWYRKAKAAAENGEFVETKGHRRMHLVLLGVVAVSMTFLLFSLQPKIAFVMLVSVVLMLGVLFGIFGVQTLLKKRGCSTNTNRAVTIGATTLITIAMIPLILAVTIGIMQSDFLEEDRIVDTYDWNGWEFDIYADEIPLKVEQLMEVSPEGYSYEAREQKSFLLQTAEFNQRMWGISDRPDLSYTVYDTGVPFISDIVRKELLKPGDYVTEIDQQGNEYYDTYIPIEAAHWGAEEAWQRSCRDYRYRDYVLIFEDRIIRIQPGWEMTVEQMRIAGEILGK